MANSDRYVTALLAALAPAGPPLVRKMFGEHALYLNGKVVALACDDALFVKDHPAARTHLPDAALAPPYPGAKAHLLADTVLDDPDPVIAALRALAIALPAPAPKPKRRK
jgi:TfoX/Sxy family transcriptional regulator of competence genes